LQSIYSIYLLVLILIGSVVTGCRPISVVDDEPNLVWTEITSTLGALPPEITVFQGTDENIPVKAWYAQIRIQPGSGLVSVKRADAATGAESVSSFSIRNEACLVVNGGYFLDEETGSRPIGLVVSDGVIVNHAIHRISSDDIRYNALRSAIGITDSGTLDIAWVSSRNDSVFAWTEAIENQQGFPAQPLPRSMSRFWPVEQALAAGPALVIDGNVDVHTDSEIFFDTPIPNIHPRTAAGINADGDLLLMIVDGRQASSRGVNLIELAGMMLDVGAVRAINLDGGGSTAMVVGDSLLNRPVGTGKERPVATAIVVRC